MSMQSALQLHTGRRMPVMGLGTWQLTVDTAGTVLHALEIGYRLIDTSSDYRTQPGIGKGIRQSGLSRKDIFLVSKVEETDDAYARTKSNLKELGVEYIDLTLIHRPPFAGSGEGLWQGLIQAKQEGLTRDIGVSNYPTRLIDDLIEETGEVPAVNQIEWSPFGQSPAMKRYCDERGIIIQAYSPLTRAKHLHDETLAAVADKYGKSKMQILIRWNLQHGTCPIPKANQKKHLEENLNVFDFEIAADDMAKLDRLNEGYSSLGSLPYL